MERKYVFDPYATGDRTKTVSKLPISDNRPLIGGIPRLPMRTEIKKTIS